MTTMKGTRATPEETAAMIADHEREKAAEADIESREATQMTTKVMTETLHIPTLEAAAALQCSYCKRPEKYGVAELDAESDLYAHRKNGSRWCDAGRIWRETENQQQVSQPIPDPGQEWSQHPYKSSLVVANFDEGSGGYEIIANTKDAKLPVHTATQIVSDHNAASRFSDCMAELINQLHTLKGARREEQQLHEAATDVAQELADAILRGNPTQNTVMQLALALSRSLTAYHHARNTANAVERGRANDFQ